MIPSIDSCGLHCFTHFTGLPVGVPRAYEGFMHLDEYKQEKGKTNREKSSGGGNGPSSLGTDSYCKQHGGRATGVDWFAST